MTKKDTLGTAAIVRSVFCACVLLLGNGAHAVVTLDGTLGRAGPVRGPDYTIPAAVGQTRGANLFHSFGEFSLTSRESATFRGPRHIQNIIGRVTGGEVSSIDGLISSEIAGANLYLLNPSGVLFGPNAQLDVSGSFFASTADYLRLANRGRFDARDPGGSTLTAAPPAAFGFLGAPAPITVAGDLSVPIGNTLGLVGGDIAISGENAVLDASSGRIELAAVASAGEVTLSSAGADLSAFDALGDVFLDNALLLVDGAVGGTIAIRAGRLVVESAELDSSSFGDTDHPGIGIDIAVRGEFALGVSSDPDGFGALIDSSSSGAGRAGDIRIEAGRFTLAGDPAGRDRFVEVTSSASGSGRGGDISVTTEALEIGPNAVIATHSRAPLAGDAGDITVNTNSLRVDGTAGFRSSIESTAFGGTGVTGNLTVSATDVLLQGGDAPFTGLSIDAPGIGVAGELTLTASRVQILDGAQIATRLITTPEGSGGNIRVRADELFIAGKNAFDFSAGIYSSMTVPGPGQVVGGNIDIAVGNLIMSRDGIIRNTLDAFTGGGAGIIRIEAQSMELSSGATVASQSNSLAAGSISIDAERLLLVGGGGTVSGSQVDFESTNAGILVRAFGGRVAPGTEPPGGVLQINSRDIQVLDGARIDTSTDTITAGGSIQIQTDRLIVAGRDAASGERSSITASSVLPPFGSRFGGRGGDIGIEAEVVELRDGGLILVKSDTPGDAGDLRIEADTISLSGNAAISATATDTGNAGNIELIARDSLRLQGSAIATEADQSAGGNITISARSVIHLTDSAITASVQGGVGDGGNIFIDPDFVILNQSRIAADAVGGNGGNVTIVAANFLASADSSVTASSTLGVQGNVVIRAPTQHLSGQLERLPQSVLDAAARFKSDCAAVGSRFSSFTVSAPSVAASGPAWMPSRYSGIGADVVSPTRYGDAPRADASLTWAKSAPAKGCSL